MATEKNTISTPPTLAVAMSGGLDSSMAAALLAREQPVVGLTMQLWNQRRLPAVAPPDEVRSGRCCSLDDPSCLNSTTLDKSGSVASSPT